MGVDSFLNLRIFRKKIINYLIAIVLDIFLGI